MRGRSSTPCSDALITAIHANDVNAIVAGNLGSFGFGDATFGITRWRHRDDWIDQHNLCHLHSPDSDGGGLPCGMRGPSSTLFSLV